MIIIIGIVFLLLSLIVGAVLRARFKKYAQIPLHSGITGREIAEQMLKDHRIYDVAVICVEGQLTDHYNPADKTINLSPDVYHGNSAASAAVAAHECGHAVQHATAYKFLEFRSMLVPVQNVSGRVLNIIMLVSIFAGSFLYSAFPFAYVLYLIIGCYTIITLFSVITLPVEFDASKRALAWIENKRIVDNSELAMAKDALKWASMTYVIAALGTVTTLIYYIMQLVGGRD